MTSLASQLQSIASLDASRLTSKFGVPSSKSYLFPPRIASSHDLDAIFSLAQSGFEELLELDPGMSEFEDDLFSESARRVDRMLLNKEENEVLNVKLERCLRRLGRWIGIMAGGKCIEWLVRRFRVHEMNADTVLKVFLPYHESPNFPRILAILTFEPTSPYHAPFSALVKKAQPLPRSYITSMVSAARDPSLHLLSDVVGLVGQAIEEGVVHRALLAFWTSTIVELLEKGRNGGGISEGTVKILVEAFVMILSTKAAGPDVNAAVYPPLVLLTRSTKLADAPFQILLSSLLTAQSGANPSQRMLTLLVILNDRPEWTSGLGSDAASQFGQIKQVGEIVVAAMGKYGFESAISVVLSTLLERLDVNDRHLKVICDSSNLLPSLVKIAATKLLLTGASTSQKNKDLAKTLLSTLRERHPALVDEAYQSISSSLPQSAESLDQPSSTFVDIYSADVSSRVRGIKEIYRILSLPSEDLERKENIDDITTALQSRLLDTDAEVIKALHSSPTNFFKVIKISEYISSISALFSSPKPEPEIIRLHLLFIRSPVILEDVANKEVFTKVLFPCLLASQSRMVFGTAEWGILSGYHLTILKDIISDARECWSIDGEPTEAGLVEWNNSLSTHLAVSIMTSNDRDYYLSFLVDQLTSTVAQSRILAHLILAEIIRNMQGSQQVELAIKVLTVVESVLKAANMSKVEDVSRADYFAAIYKKTGQTKTGQLAALDLLEAVGKVVRPVDEQIVWVDDESSTAQAVSYKSLAIQIYRLTNSPHLPPNTSRHLLQNLFLQTSSEVLLLLSSIWLSPSQTTTLRTSALKHAQAFVSACTKSTQTDFQMVIPALLVALQDEKKEVREAAVGVLKCVYQIPARGAVEIYALDTSYGSRSNLVQLLKQADVHRYLETLVQASDDIIIDAGRLKTVHTAMLGPQHGQAGKKDLSYRRAVISSLMSHTLAFRSFPHRKVLLNLLVSSQSTSFLQGVLPLLEPLIDESSEEAKWLAARSKDDQKTYLDLLVGALSIQSVKVLEVESEAWKLFSGLVNSTSTSRFGSKLRAMSIKKFAEGVFAHLDASQQVIYLLVLVSSLRSLSTDEVFASREALTKLLLSPESIIEVIHSLSTPLESSSHRKRQKQDDSDESDKLDQAVSDLTVFIDSRDWKNVPGNAELVASLMSVLSALLSKRQSITQGVDYLEQEVLAAILAIVEKIQDATEITRAHVGIEVIIKVIRASTNPRTSQRALLVASELARLIPDAVLHNIMPIFTFMGASDFQRDDAYSFGVVEKTISRIVPVMTKSLTDKATSKLELYNESLTFISIFTDMANRLPKHRTLPFFVHLVKSLGPIDFLAPISMLLVDRANTKAGRSNGTSPLELALSLVSSFDLITKEEVLLQVVSEITRLVSDLSMEDKEAFLNQTTNENERPDIALKRITSLLTFATGLGRQLAEKSCTQSTIEEVVRLLITLSAKTSQPVMKGTEIGPAMETTLATVMQLLSVEGFLTVTVKLLESGTDQDVNMCLTVFQQRLPLIRVDLRTKFASVLSDIIKRTSSLLAPSSSNTAIALATLRAVVSTAVPSEDTALSQVVPKLVEISSKVSESSLLVSAYSVIELTIRRLQSRIIPSIQSIIETSLVTVKSSKSSPVIKQALKTVSSVIETVPAFITSKQLSAVLSAGIHYRGKDETTATAFISAVAKKIPTKTLFPVVMEIWKTVQQDTATAMEGFFHLLRLSLKNADRKALATLLKPIFAFFLEVFDLRHKLQLEDYDSQAIDRIEESAIGSFLELVTKLNEATFKPLFIRLYDWAVIDLAEGKAVGDARLTERKIVLLHVMMGLLQKFRHLLSPYIGTLLPHIEELLDAYADGDITDLPLWTLLLEVLGKSFEVDDGAYWTEQLHLRLIPHLIAQIPLYTTTSTLASTLTSLAASTTSETTLKSLNSSICLATRAESPQTRMSALRVLDSLWSNKGTADELLGFVPETVSEFLAELLEDENSEVEGLARKVLGKIEGFTGSLKEYLE